MSGPFSQKTAKVVVVDPSSTRRFMLLEAIRKAGYASPESLGEGKDLLAFLEVETPDWVVMPLFSGEPINAMQILKIATKFARFRNLRLSIFLQEDELACIPLAFELGAMSWHLSASIKEAVENEIRTLINSFEREGWDSTLLAASYLRKHLIARRLHQQLLSFSHDLCQQYPGHARQLLHLAEAQVLTGSTESASITLEQVALLGPELSSEVTHFRQKYLDDDDFSSAIEPSQKLAKVTRVNALGISNCVVIDPDTAMHYALTNLLKEFGVPQIDVFSDGEEAWAWLKDHPEPGLIIAEWRLPGLPGPLLVQRIRSHQYIQVPIVVVSSLIKASEIPLVQEMGVAAVIEKPFNHTTVIRSLAWVLQQQRHPTEQHSLERKMRQELELGMVPEATRLLALFKGDSRISESAKKVMEAEFAYSSGNFVQARDLAIEAVKSSGDSLMLYNLLGKSMLKTGQYELALKCFSKAQKISPGNIERLCRIAEIHHDLGQGEEAARTLEDASKLDATSPLLQSTSANLALLNGDTNKAKSIMAQLDSVAKLLALMNNRAVAMTKGGQFDAGIELYRNTLEALPGAWSRIHDAVSYNLGLAYGRYGELEKCLVELNNVQDNSPALKRKATSLARRVKVALDGGLALNLLEETKKDENPTSDGSSTASNDAAEFVSLDIRRGDLCCYMIYRALDLADPKTLAMFSSPLMFQERQAIVRDVSIGRQVKGGG